MSIYNTNNFKKIFAFTLAEVLITLGIIGVVAAMTIPTLMNSTQNKETVTALKKAYSTLSQAYTMAEQENGTPDTWDLGGVGNSGTEAGATEIYNKLFAPYIRINKYCGITAGCLAPSYKYLKNTAATFDSDTGMVKGQTADGSLFYIFSHGACSGNAVSVRGSTKALQNTCASIGYDINGLKKPNAVGKDFFHFYMTTEGIIPTGTSQETTFPFDTDCIAMQNGYGCTAWVIYNENLDYLKCNTLSWSGPTKCN